MRIVEIQERTVPIRSAIRNAWISFAEMTCSVVAITTDVRRNGAPIVGFGFSSNGRYGQGGLLRERFIPRLLAAEPAEITDASGFFDPGRVWDVLMRNEKPGGHGERSVAVGVIDMAIWDIVAKIQDQPLAATLADRVGRHAVPEVEVYAAGGYYYPGKDLDSLRAELSRYLAAGHTRVKIKIGGASLAQDLGRIETALEVVGAANRLAVDANGRLSVEDAISYARAIEPFGLLWYEEPVDPLDYDGHRQVCEAYEEPIATGENLFSVADVRNLLRHGGLRRDRDILQMDPVLSYGLTEYLRMLDLQRDHGWSPSSCLPHGGHLLNMHAAAALGLGGAETYPEVFWPFGHLGDETRIADGAVQLSDMPGLGVEGSTPLYEALAG
jgi:L-alanine-DL-glutamate epimerase-like enolase superfamily enzyme